MHSSSIRKDIPFDRSWNGIRQVNEAIPLMDLRLSKLKSLLRLIYLMSMHGIVAIGMQTHLINLLCARVTYICFGRLPVLTLLNFLPP